VTGGGNQEQISWLENAIEGVPLVNDDVLRPAQLSASSVDHVARIVDCAV
jgi:hypothetical protein